MINVADNQDLFFDDLTSLIDRFQNKLGLAACFENIEKQQQPQKAAEISFAYFIGFIFYKTLADKNCDSFRTDFAQRVEQIHHDVKYGANAEALKRMYNIFPLISRYFYHPFSPEQSFINKKAEHILKQPEPQDCDISPWLEIIDFINRYDFSDVKTDIFGDIYENYFKPLYEKQNKGQYFTDSAIAGFMLDEIGFTTTRIRREFQNFRRGRTTNLSLIDPSCGSGAFLCAAADRIMNALQNSSRQELPLVWKFICDNIFGFDIDNFPLYLAKMSILLRILPLIAGTGQANCDIKICHTEDSISEFLNTPNASGRTNFDFVVGNPPYLGYNECCRQRILFTELIKKKKILMSDIYGVNLHNVPNYPQKSPPKPNLYAFFIALGLGILKDNGTISYIVPQTLLTAASFAVLRFHLAQYTTIDKIIAFDGNIFNSRGIRKNKAVATSSLIFIARQQKPAAGHKVKIIRYKDNFSSRRKTSATIKQSDLLENFENWNFLQYLDQPEILKFCNQYEKNEDLSQYYDHTLSKQKFKSAFYFDIGYDIDESNLSETAEGYLYPKINNRYYNIFETRGYYPFGHSVKRLKNNQEFHLLNSPYKIIWSYNNPRKFHYTDQKVIWARNSICGIGSQNRDEILYLWALLNSPVNKKILDLKLRNSNEKALLISLQAIRRYIKAPRITTDKLKLKKEIIRQSGELLSGEQTRPDIPKLKKYIDDLVYALYFDIKIAPSTLSFAQAADIAQIIKTCE